MSRANVLTILTALTFTVAISACGDDDNPAGIDGGMQHDSGQQDSGGQPDAGGQSDGGGQPSAYATTLTDVSGTPSATGSVALIPDGSGGYTLILGADFMQEMGPGDTELRLAKGEGKVSDQLSADASSVTDALDIVPNGHAGSRTVSIPSSVGVADFSHVIIWCPTASVNFAVGELATAANGAAYTATLNDVSGTPAATGAVTLLPDGSGGYTLALGPDFMQETGPGDTELRLAKGDGKVSDQLGADASSVTDALDIVPNGFSGARTVSIPSSVGVTDFSYVIIWCPTASVNFSVGMLAAP